MIARLTLWLAGLLVSLMTGNLVAFVILTLLYVGSRAYAQVRALQGGAKAIGRGDQNGS